MNNIPAYLAHKITDTTFTVNGHEVAPGTLIGVRHSMTGEENFARYIGPAEDGRHEIVYESAVPGVADSVREYQIFALLLGEYEDEMVTIRCGRF